MGHTQDVIMKKYSKKHITLIVVGAVLGFFYAYQNGQKGWASGGFAFLGAIIGCIAYTLISKDSDTIIEVESND